MTPDGKLVVGDVFLDTTLKNIAANNGRIAVSVYDAQNLEGYQVKGTAQYVTGGEVVKAFKAMGEKMFSGAATDCQGRTHHRQRHRGAQVLR